MHKLDHTSWMMYVTISFGLPQLLRTLPCLEDKGVYEAQNFNFVTV